MPTYTVYMKITSGSEYTLTASNVEEAEEAAVQLAQVDNPTKDVRVWEVEEHSSYNPYSAANSSATTPTAGEGYTAYSSLVEQGASSVLPGGSSYTPYSTTAKPEMTSAQTAGYSCYASSLPSSPVKETSFHKTIGKGYAPYRSFRVKLP